ncbi:WecB/TagA/CpsF family glycosyltransferase [Oryzibacter oryziterrae]|uniref:WecB/TagA/CpsF family glycosyltransferase n=1 Tax=Oryzibacter oryziterrae TaxID=2766474 RepID=UPI001F238F75|nr:WecB/TagA/CpsF family glycosyltransferase [Oryzibacter oryziterrae]
MVDHTRINIGTQADLVARLIDDALGGRGGTTFTLNLDHLVKLERDLAFRVAYDRATYVTADGEPVVRMARAQGARIVRVTGADLVRPLCAAAAEAGVALHFFGSSMAILEAAATALTKEFPGLNIAAMESPPFGFAPFGSDSRASAERIAASGAKICLVALGAPKQETFANFATQWAPGVNFVCIGAALDFIGGGQKRAPQFMQESGLEWLWRLVNNPKRLTKRYALSALYLARYHVRRGFRWVVQGGKSQTKPADRT